MFMGSHQERPASLGFLPIFGTQQMKKRLLNFKAATTTRERHRAQKEREGLTMEKRGRDEKMGGGAGPRGPPGRPLPPPPPLPQSRAPPPRRFEPVDREKVPP